MSYYPKLKVNFDHESSPSNKQEENEYPVKFTLRYPNAAVEKVYIIYRYLDKVKSEHGFELGYCGWIKMNEDMFRVDDYSLNWVQFSSFEHKHFQYQYRVHKNDGIVKWESDITRLVNLNLI